MTHSSFNTAMLGLITALVLGLAGLNLFVDPYSVFGTSPLPDGSSSNERYLKIEHLRQHPGRYELLMFGSSRFGMTDPAWVESWTGLTAYNLSVFSGKPTDMARLYDGAKEAGTMPSAVLVGLDAMAFLSEMDNSDLSRRHHPSVADIGLLRYWMDYLVAPSVLPSVEKLLFHDAPQVTFSWRNGTYALTGYERQIAEDHHAYMLETFGAWHSREFDSSINLGQWHVLTAWLDELERDGVDVTIFLQPMHRQWQARMAPLMPGLRALFRDLDEFQDLSHLGSKVDEHWYEQRHYREPIARGVLEALYARSGSAESTVVRR